MAFAESYETLLAAVANSHEVVVNVEQVYKEVRKLRYTD